MKLVSFSSFALIFTGYLIFRYVFALVRNVAAARKSGMPYIVRLVPSNPLWWIFGNKIIALLKRIPILPQQWVLNFERFNSHGWEANERHRMYEEYGCDIMMLVTPAGNSIYLGDPVAITEMLRRKEDFRRNTRSRKMLDVFDRSLTSTDGTEWQRHRKVSAMTFTEKNNALVWDESLKQAQGLLEYWTERAKAPIRSIQQDTQTFTTNVLAAALLAKPYRFIGHEDPQPEKLTEEESVAYQYRQSLSVILEKVVIIMIFGSKTLQKSWMPKSLQRAGAAVDSFRSYAEGLINEEKARIRSGGEARSVPSLVNLLVRACESEQEEAKKAKVNARTLTDSEIISNLFVFAFAGRDTTAITLSHVMVFLAAHPEIQDWIREELQHYLPGSDSTKWDYEQFSKLKRCLAVTYETLRLCHPSSLLLKVSPPTPLQLEVNGKNYTIPPSSSMHGSLSAMHTHPDFYGPDPLAWRPSRFISTEPPSTPSNAESSVFETEVVPPDTTVEFLAWSSGPRLCPGKKFAQVEIVAVLAKMFFEHRIEAVPEKGESLAQAQDRLHRQCMTVEQKVIFNMKDPHKAGVRWVKC